MPDVHKRVWFNLSPTPTPQSLWFSKDISAIFLYFFLKSILVASSYLVRDADIKSLTISTL